MRTTSLRSENAMYRFLNAPSVFSAAISASDRHTSMGSGAPPPCVMLPEVSATHTTCDRLVPCLRMYSPSISSTASRSAAPSPRSRCTSS